MGGSTTTYNLTNVGSLSIDALDQAAGTSDSLTFGVGPTDSYNIVPGQETGSGLVTVQRPGVGNLLPIFYRHFESITPVTGDLVLVTAPGAGA